MKNEIKNNVVHLFIGAVVGAGIYLCWYYSRFIFPVLCTAHVVVFVVSIAIEIFQFYKWDNKELKIYDRITDVMGYQIGCWLILFYTRLVV